MDSENDKIISELLELAEFLKNKPPCPKSNTMLVTPLNYKLLKLGKKKFRGKRRFYKKYPNAFCFLQEISPPMIIDSSHNRF